MGKCFDKLVDFNNIYNSYIHVCKKSNKSNLSYIEFKLNPYTNLEKIISELKNGTYKPKIYHKFTIYEPKERLIYAPDFRDKIVQVNLDNILREIIYPRFIPDSYGSIKSKGTHACADKIQHNMRTAYNRWGKNSYTVRMDIKKFFYNINRDIMKRLYRKHIKEDKILELLDSITDSAEVIGEKGLPLGNTISQLSANIYLNELDQYLKRKYQLRYYVRYMDDVVIQVENKEKAKIVLEDANIFLKDRLDLELNLKKSTYYPINHCVNCVGFKIWITHRKLRNSSKKTLKSIINEANPEKFTQRFYSWYGNASKARCYSFIETNINRKYKVI